MLLCVIWSDVLDKLVEWLKDVQKGCSLSTSFIFFLAFDATGIPVKPTWLYILLFGVKLVHVAVPTVFAIVGFKSGFSADSGTQCLRIYLLSF